MKFYQRMLCLFLSILLLVIYPLTSFAATSAVPSVSEYIFDTLLGANGVDVPLSSVKSWVGAWSGYDDYVAQGQRGELGSYSQWLYDRSQNAELEEIRTKARAQIDTMTNWMSMDWSDVGGTDISLGSGILNGWVDGVKGSASDYATSLRGYLDTFSSYGTDALDYIKNLIISEPTFSEWTKPSTFGAYIGKCGAYDFVYTTTYYLYIPSILESTDEVYAYLSSYNASSQKWNVKFAYNKKAGSDIGKSFPTHIYTCVMRLRNSTGAITYASSEISSNAGQLMDVEDIKNLPIPVFSSKAVADEYVVNQRLEGIYNQPAIGMPVSNVNKDAQTAEIKISPTVITLPQTGEQAAELLDQLSGAMDRIDELELALKNAGLAIGWADVVLPTVAPSESASEGTGEDAETKIQLANILAKVEAIPATIEAILNRKIEPENSEKDVEDMKLPVSISDKFPFCIPFDLAYLVKSLSASSEVPRFELPFKIDYLSFHYDHIFVLDMSDWDVAVQIFRGMLDVLFLAGLITITRDLIRG